MTRAPPREGRGSVPCRNGAPAEIRTPKSDPGHFVGFGRGLSVGQRPFLPISAETRAAPGVCVRQTLVIQAPKLGARIMRYELAVVTNGLPSSPCAEPCAWRSSGKRPTCPQRHLLGLRSGAPWRSLRMFDSYDCNRFVRWRAGVWGRIIDACRCSRCCCPDDRHYPLFACISMGLHHAKPAPIDGRSRGSNEQNSCGGRYVVYRYGWH